MILRARCSTCSHFFPFNVSLHSRLIFGANRQVCIVAFSLEYVLRLFCCTRRPVMADETAGICNYFWKPMNMIDIVAIAPFWIELFLGGQISLGVLRMLRMTRIFRVLKVGVSTVAQSPPQS